MKTSEIHIGTRHRRDLGDIDSLAASIDGIGLLHPIVINEANELIAGGRRLAAVRRLGWAEVAVTVAKNILDIEAALRAEKEENLCRKDLTPSEAAALAKALEPFEQKAAAERKAATRKKGQNGDSDEISRPVNLTGRENHSKNGDASDRVANAVGMSRASLTKAQAVVEAAEKHPAHYADLQEKMDRSGKVAPAYRELAERQKAEDAPKTRLPHRVEFDDFEESAVDEVPVPDGPTPAEIAKADPALNLGKMIRELQGGVNSFLFNGTLKALKSLPISRRQPLARRLGELVTEMQKLQKELE
jgi:ParB-like chromosome segregation protein Spo0J